MKKKYKNLSTAKDCVRISQQLYAAVYSSNEFKSKMVE